MRRHILTRALKATHAKPLSLEAYTAKRQRLILALLASHG